MRVKNLEIPPIISEWNEVCDTCKTGLKIVNNQGHEYIFVVSSVSCGSVGI